MDTHDHNDDRPEDQQPLLPHGTVRIFEQFNQHGLVLHPPPTASPDDPLNWSAPRKFISASLVLFITGLTAATSNSFSVAGTALNGDYGVTWNQINTAAGVLFLAIGFGTVLLSSAPWLYGRRISYLICLGFSIIGNAWMGRVTNAGGSIGCQLFVGASESVAEATVQLSLSDITFQHQRGLVLGLYVLATSTGTFLGPIISSYIADSNLNWPWVGWFAAIISAVTLVVTYLGLEETGFERPARSFESNKVSIPVTHNPLHSDSSAEKAPAHPATAGVQPVVTAPEYSEEKHTTSEEIQPLKTYWQRIALITPASNLVGTGFVQYWQRMWNNIKIFWLPAVVYAGLQWGFQDAWLSFYLTAEEDNWTSAPYNYGDVGSGLMCLPTLIGAVIGCVYGGYFSDFFVRQIARRNNGIYEAEHRLWLMVLPAILCPIGLIIFGYGTYADWPWPPSYIGLGFVGFGWGCAGDLSMAYTMDAYPEMVLEGMVGVSFINNSLACIFTFVCSQWMAVNSVAEVFITIGIVAFFVMFPLTLLMIFYGKRLRIWTSPRYEAFLASRR